MRRHAVIYWHDGPRVFIAASQAGAPHHPAWYHNLVAHPDVTFGGIPMRAEPVAGVAGSGADADAAELERLWTLGNRVFPAFATYRRRAAAAGRTIPLIELTPRRGVGGNSD